VDEAEAVSYLLSNHPEWRKDYHLFNNHWAAMTVVAADLSKDCGLNVHADSIWVGGGCESLGMVFTGNSMGHKVRTPEDTNKLEKLEKRLVELKFVTTPKLDVLCSSSFLDHTEEPYEMAGVPPINGLLQGSRIIELTEYWRGMGERDHRRQAKQKRNARRAEGGKVR